MKTITNNVISISIQKLEIFLSKQLIDFWLITDFKNYNLFS